MEQAMPLGKLANGWVLFRECDQTKSGSVSASNCRMWGARERYRDIKEDRYHLGSIKMQIMVLRAHHKIP